MLKDTVSVFWRKWVSKLPAEDKKLPFPKNTVHKKQNVKQYLKQNKGLRIAASSRVILLKNLWQSPVRSDAPESGCWLFMYLFLNSREILLRVEPRVPKAFSSRSTFFRDHFEHGDQEICKLCSIFRRPTILLHKHIKKTPRFQLGNVSEFSCKQKHGWH